MNCTDEIKNEIMAISGNNKLCRLYEELVDKKYSINNLNLWFNYYHNFVYEKNIKIEEREKRSDSTFRNDVKNKYLNKCMITGKPIKVCEVAHIFPHSAANIDDKYNVDNGFLLCRELHLLFDHKDFDFKINPDTCCIELSNEIMNDETMDAYHKYNGKNIKLNKNNIKYLRMKYNQ
jgi:predicted restriction endonuclease